MNFFNQTEHFKYDGALSKVSVWLILQCSYDLQSFIYRNFDLHYFCICSYAFCILHRMLSYEMKKRTYELLGKNKKYFHRESVNELH